MKPRSLLVRDRSRIGTFGATGRSSSPNNNPPPPPLPLLIASGNNSIHSSAAAAASSYAAAYARGYPCAQSTGSRSRSTLSSLRRISSSVSASEPLLPQVSPDSGGSSCSTAARGQGTTILRDTKRDHQPQQHLHQQWQSNCKWLIEFTTSLIGGSIGAYVVLFLSGSNESHEHHHASLILSMALMIPMILAELWEYYFLEQSAATRASSSSSSSTHTGKPATASSSGKQAIRELRATKKAIELRYGQGLFMSAQLAKVLSLKEANLLLHTLTWTYGAAWMLWTMLFTSGTALLTLASTSSTTASSSSSSSPSSTETNDGRQSAAARRERNSSNDNTTTKPKRKKTIKSSNKTLATAPTSRNQNKSKKKKLSSPKALTA